MAVSLKSDHSIGRYVDFKRHHGPDGLHASAPPEGLRSHEPGLSMDQRETREDGAPPSKKAHRPAPGAMAVSLKSDHSIGRYVDFKRLHGPEIHQKHPPSEPGPICESLRSDRSMRQPLNFSTEPVEQQGPEVSSGQHHQTQLDSIFKLLEEDIFTFVQKELKKLHKVLSTDYPECLEPVKDEDEEQRSSSEAVLKITLNFLRRMKQKELAERLWSRSYSGVCQRKLKSNLKQKFECVFEGIAKAGNPTLLNQIYTELYITEGGSSEVNQEHEVRHMETASRKPDPAETPITCEDMFKGPAHTHGPIRTVLTKGVAGIGKTVLTQKFSLDWAEGKANQDIQLLFPFTFRALNVLKERSFSLVTLVHHFFSQTQTQLCSFEDLQVLFIFDGLDECRLPLDFTKTKALTDPTESTSLHVLLVNLIRGSLLPSARLWITTRPAAANQIPAECVSMVTEVRGFTDPQKEQYFRKRFTDEADTIISHIKTSRSLHIMCYMPIFCWIAATVLEHVLKSRERDELPKTLTQMYIHFLVVQAKVKNIKYEGGSETDPHWSLKTRKMVKSLGKLAFEQLQRGNLIFYECDLRECGLDAAAASVYSGVFTQVFREEPGLYQDKVYCFIHLSVQEFLAALHVRQTFINTGINLLSENQTSLTGSSKSIQFYQTAVEQALQSPNGHLDLLLRFLLGLSLPTNQSLLQGLLKQTGKGSRTHQKTAEYIKEKLSEDVSAERSINLLHCLNELNDRSLVEQIQRYLSSGRLSEGGLSPAQCSALAFILLSSEEALDQFELKKYSASEKALLKLLPVVKASNKALLSGCDLSERSCEALSSVLSSQSSSLTVLDLSHNDLKDSGLEMLSVGLKSPHCKVEQLSLSLCGLSPHSCGPLASVLSSSSLTHLDLSGNDLQDSGVELLCSGLKSAPCRLEILRLSGCLVSQRGGAALSSVLSSQSSSLTVLDLSHNDLKDSGLEMLSVGLKSPHCKVEQLRLSGCLVSEEGCASLASALRSNPSHLRELDLSYNHPGDRGVKLLSALQEDPHCKLDTLRLSPAGERWMNPIRRYFCDLTLDPNTAQIKLKLSDNNKKVTRVTEEQPYPDHQDRFEDWAQILCSTGLTGRCYWEVQWSGQVHISVSYRRIRRKGHRYDSAFGLNDQSWSLSCSEDGFSVHHNNKRTFLPQPWSSSSGTVSVFVDCPAGSLSFYTVSSDQLTHLHTFNTTFTDTLLPGFWLCYDSSVSLCRTDSPSSV
ncbi:NACHT, LRR and PYD domains-containing protein 3-like isoform X2 [Periophthalmus magnuspinnatus]|uniref:NACHT, LRR and PYD domains-containing protein 3-like isoform X2 n=1 Tax=Periophthalmus magnuspinnatus TaxID=409849 RepID=UPI00145B8E01|nr:NACHT, LRR and PYD domains-containing protein 3-like isoform X2 [Periophthalmus magnuspinnatus]